MIASKNFSFPLDRFLLSHRFNDPPFHFRWTFFVVGLLALHTARSFSSGAASPQRLQTSCCSAFPLALDAHLPPFSVLVRRRSKPH